MAIVYAWKVTSIKVTEINDTQNVVVYAYWEKTGKDEEGNEGTFYGGTSFSTNNALEGSTFIPFDELTETEVIEWIKASIADGYEQHINEQINKLIFEKKNILIEKSLPWDPSNMVSNTTNIIQ